MVILLVLIIIENFVVISLNVLTIVLEKVFAYLDNVNVNQDGQDLIVILKKKIVNILLQRKIQHNVFNNALKVNMQILTKYVEISVLMVFIVVYYKKNVFNVMQYVKDVLVLQVLIVQTVVFLHIQKIEYVYNNVVMTINQNKEYA